MELLIIALLVAFNGIFVAAEFALLGVPRTTIAAMASGGHRGAKIIHEILEDPVAQDRYIATAQLGITLASLGLGMYGERVIAHWIEQRIAGTGIAQLVSIHLVASVLSVTFLTYIHIVLGEMVPKTVALQSAKKTVLWVSRPMVWVKILMLPLVLLLNGLGNLILKMVGIDRHVRGRSGQEHSIEELQYIVEESRELGLLQEQSSEVIQELLEFSDLTAREVMVPRVHINAIPIDASPEEVREILDRMTHTRYPVYQGDLDHIRGVAHIKDVLRALLRSEPLGSRYVHEPPYVPETAPLNDVLEAMIRGRSQMVVVMDEHGGTEGVVTLEDLFEEVIGQIEETATQRPPIVIDALGRLIVSGTVRLEEIGEELDADLEHEEIDTASGLILSLLGRPPRVGDVVEWQNLRFHVTRIRGRGVDECMITALESS
jgi:CBS domain containing-hemolysin-like protein